VKVRIDYTNWRGRRSWRTITPQSIAFSETKWHADRQWILTAWDHDKGALRGFAMAGIHAWEPVKEGP
jgi:predicted DNA-binding transcriptional regulator YafY